MIEDMDERTQNEIQQKIKYFKKKNNNPSLHKKSQIYSTKGFLGNSLIDTRTLNPKTRANSNNLSKSHSKIYKMV